MKLVEEKLSCKGNNSAFQTDLIQKGSSEVSRSSKKVTNSQEFEEDTQRECNHRHCYHGAHEVTVSCKQ